jgi:hypothetical protein
MNGYPSVSPDTRRDCREDVTDVIPDLVSYGRLKPGLDDVIRRDAVLLRMHRKAAEELLHIQGWPRASA